MVRRFLKSYGMNKAAEALDEFSAAVISFDPKIASNAQIEMMDAELLTLGRRLADAETEMEREHQETICLRRTYNEYLEAARLLEAKLSDGAASQDRTEIEASLAKVVSKLEERKPEIEREEQEDREVEAWHAALRRSVEALSNKLRQAKSEPRSARRQTDIPSLRNEHAEERDKHARATAGVTSSISAMSVALDAMNQQTEKLRAEAETLQLRAGLFQVEPLDADPHIAAALDAARGKASTNTKSLSERLAALKERPAAAGLTAAE